MAQKNLNTRISWRRDTSANWTLANPVLLNGEIIVVDTAEGEVRFKIGDGSKTYTKLPFEDEVIRNLINGKSFVLVSDTLNDGVAIGKITVDDTETVLYAPKYTAGNGINIDDNNKISTSVNFNTKANIASPTFTGTPKAPTATVGTNTTQIATTAFVKTAVDNLASGTKVSSAASADTATSASGLDSTGIAQVKGIKVDAATTADSATTASFASKTTGTLTVNVNGTSTTFNGSSNKYVTIDAASLGLSAAMSFKGSVTTLPTSGNINGDVVLYGNKEYVWDGDSWIELGDEGSHALKTITITAGDGLTGGGTLEANRTISHADTSSVANLTADGRKYVTGLTFDGYGHVIGYTTGTETVTAPTVNNGTLTIQKNGTNVATFTANQSTAATANITVPTKVSELTNDSGYKTTDTDTKVNVKTRGTTKAYLLATTTAPTSNDVGHTAVAETGVYLDTTAGKLVATSVYGAVWNDYAEYRQSDILEAGRVVCENGDDTLSLAIERLQPGAEIVSDTFGFAIGETEKCKTPIAVSGRVLAYPYEDRDSYKPGDAVCAAPGGTVSKMTREEIKEYPERIVGTVSAIPEYKTWGEGNVPVNERIWIKVK